VSAAAPPTVARSLLALTRFIISVTRWRGALGLAFLLLASLTEGISVVLLIPIISVAGAGRGAVFAGVHLPAWLLPRGNLGLAAMLSLYVVVVVLRGVLMRFKEISMIDILFEVTNRLRIGLFASIAFARWGFISTLRSADLDHALSAEVNRVQLTIYQVFIAVQSVIMLFIYAAISAVISPGMTLFAAVFGLVLFGVMRPVRRATSEYGQNFSKQTQTQFRIISDFIGSIKVAKSFNAEPAYIRKLSGHLDDTRAASARMTRITSTGAVMSQFITAGGMAVFAYAALTYFQLPFAKIIILLFAFMRMAPRISGLQENFHQIILNLPAYDTMRQLESECGAAREEAEDAGQPALELKDRLSFEQVTFAYHAKGDGHIFAASFYLPANRITALIGPSGSGKSTIADLMMGLIEPAQGRILIDGQALAPSNRRAWRDQVAYVPQDVFLTHDTISENLRIARPGASEAEMWRVLEAANAAAFIEALPDRLQTVLGDRGLRVSGGERQRIALARALLRRPRLLILDEGTSALDWENQSMVARSIEALRGQMTVLTIAHRPSMIAFADWVIAIEGGRIAEAGPYADIITNPDSHLSRIINEESMIG
jgi:ATP-binding cassette subfamily C protein